MKLTAKSFLVLLLVVSLSLFVFLPPGQSEIIAKNNESSHNAVLCQAPTVTEETKISSRLIELIFGKDEKSERVILIPGGGIFGAKIKQSYVTVQNPGECRELKVGDKILSINNTKITSVNDA